MVISFMFFTKYNLVNKYDLPLEDENGKISIDFKTFMEMMTDNIITNRKAFGREATTYESGKSYVYNFYIQKHQLLLVFFVLLNNNCILIRYS